MNSHVSTLEPSIEDDELYFGPTVKELYIDHGNLLRSIVLDDELSFDTPTIAANIYQTYDILLLEANFNFSDINSKKLENTHFVIE